MYLVETSLSIAALEHSGGSVEISVDIRRIHSGGSAESHSHSRGF